MFTTVVGIVVAVVVAFGLMGFLFLLAYFIENNLNNGRRRGQPAYRLPTTAFGRRGAFILTTVAPVQRTHVARTSQVQIGLSIAELDKICPTHPFNDVELCKVPYASEQHEARELTVQDFESEEKTSSERWKWEKEQQSNSTAPPWKDENYIGKDSQDRTETLVTNDYCPICLEEFSCTSLVRTLPCKHVFHSHELERWFSKSSFCPICRIDLKPSVENENPV
eukprot:jgi/Galph1/2539/GphlegSOOS_G1213.1